MLTFNRYSSHAKRICINSKYKRKLDKHYIYNLFINEYLTTI